MTAYSKSTADKSPLSKSSLWGKMQDYYNEIGPEAWTEEQVPLQISSNKNLAAAYAQIIVAQIDDWHATNQINSKEPFYIVEIGAGHGRFGFYILKLLEQFLADFDLPLSTIKYVMTDISAKNVASWERHPGFVDYFDNGILEVKVFDALVDQSIELNGIKLGIHGVLSNKPIFMVGNYLFDSLPHDAFVVQNKELFEVRIALAEHNDKDFSETKYSYARQKITADYYDDLKLNAILRQYQHEIKEGAFVLPVGGITCIANLGKMTSAGVVALIADKGNADIRVFEGIEDPDISEHGSVSLMVNFDALRRYYATPGTALMMHNTATDFQVCVLISSALPKITHTKNVFNYATGDAGPQDLVNLVYEEDDINENYSTLDQLIGLLNLSMWDPAIFYDLHDQLLEFIEEDELTLEQHYALELGAQQVWKFYFKVESSQDVPFALGGLYYALDEEDLALKFFKLSCQEFGENTDNLYNIALCYQALENDTLATEFSKKILVVDPNYKPAKELLLELKK